MDAAELARRLLGKPVTADRISKVPKLLLSTSHYQAFLAELPADVRSVVDAQLADLVTVKFQ